MFSELPYLSFGSSSEDSESDESPPTFLDLTKPPPVPTMFWEDPSCSWDLQRSQDLAAKLLECQRESPSQSEAVEKQVQVAAFDSSVPPPGFVSSIHPR